jgi:multidrug efflux pump subunit AcrB
LEWTGGTKQELEAGGLVLLIFAAAYLFAYLFLVAQYESWALPNAVMLPIVIAVVGAVLPLAALPLPWLTNNLYAQIGIVMLIGLASKSAILIVEFAIIRRKAGDSVLEASLNAANLRYRAVLMTALSFILGVMPLMFASGAGSASRSVVGFVVFFGMLFATLIGTLFVPVFYYTLQNLRERFNRFPKTKALKPE